MTKMARNLVESKIFGSGDGVCYMPLSSGSPEYLPAVCLNVPAFPSLLFQSDFTQRLSQPSFHIRSRRKILRMQEGTTELSNNFVV